MGSGWLAFPPVQLRIFTEPQMGATYDDLLAVARRTEETGFDAFFRSDHYLAMGGDGRPGPTDAWITLAGLARDTSRIRLGTLGSSATFRPPRPFADAHPPSGLPFPSGGSLFDRLEEQLEIISGLLRGEGPFSFDGAHHQLRDNPALAVPVQQPPPLARGVGRT